MIPPTAKQIDLIQKLGGDPNRSTTSNEALKQIRFLLGNQKITPKQQSLVLSLPQDQVKEILKREVVIEEMTRFDLSRVMNVLQNRHQLAPKVYNHPISSNIEYEYGWQESDKCPDGRMYYLVYYNLLMIDIDGSIDISEFEIKVQSLNLTGRLYRTYNGYHFFVTSDPIYHKSPKAQSIMSKLGCDIYYIAFSHLNGYKVRLNPKHREDEKIAATFIQIVGLQPEDTSLVELIQLHDNYLIKHQR
jgi:hypothetical protein